MPYIENTMSQFNKNNPYVILAKQEYDSLNKILQSISVDVIKYLIFTTGPIFISILILIWSCINNLHNLIIGSIIFTCLSLLVVFIYYMTYRKRTDYYLHKDPGFIEFSRLSVMEMSEITKLGSEDVLRCLHMMYEMKGGLRVEARNFRILGIKLFCFTLVCCLMCMIGLIYILIGG